jgi:oxygen-independent coproporphyrinogen-3 oxidase
MTPSESCSRPGLYLHIPFCLHKCGYCGFYSVTDLALIPPTLAGLRREMSLYADRVGPFDSVYIGGGTPSVLGAAELERLIDDVLGTFPITADAEITLETNPGDVTRGLLEALRRAGVNRLTIGCQSFHDEALAFLGRRHTARQDVEAVERSREAGFDNIGLDLIYGLPSLSGDAFADWLATLQTALFLRTEHLSCYQLTVEPHTPLAERIAGDARRLPDEEEQRRYFLRTSEILEDAGYRHYEISNFAREDRFRSRHNSKYWDHTPYLGLGPAAHSFDGRRRRWNHRSVVLYLQDLSEGKPPVDAAELLTDAELCLEALFLGMRTSTGIHMETFRKRYGLDLQLEKEAVLTKLAQEGLVEIRDGYLRPTRAGMAIADSLALI